MDQDDDLPILKDEVINAIRCLNDGKSPGHDNISKELLKHGEYAIINVFTELFQKSWSMKKWPAQWTQSLVIGYTYTSPRKVTSENVKTIEP